MKHKISQFQYCLAEYSIIIATVTTLKYLVFDLHIILIKLIVDLIAYGLHFKMKFEFNIIGNILWNALKANTKYLYFIISGSFPESHHSYMFINRERGTHPMSPGIAAVEYMWNLKSSSWFSVGLLSSPTLSQRVSHQCTVKHTDNITIHVDTRYN